MRHEITTEIEVSFLKAQLHKATLLGEKTPGAEMETLQKFLELERQSKAINVIGNGRVIPFPCSKPSLA